MAGEEVFVASAINTFSVLLVFLTLYLVAKLKDHSHFWQHIWLAGIFLMLTYTFAVDKFAFNVTGAYDLRDTVDGHIVVFVWLSYLMLAAVMLSLLYFIFRTLVNMFSRKKDKLPKPDEYYGDI